MTIIGTVLQLGYLAIKRGDSVEVKINSANDGVYEGKFDIGLQLLTVLTISRKKRRRKWQNRQNTPFQFLIQQMINVLMCRP